MIFTEVLTSSEGEADGQNKLNKYNFWITKRPEMVCYKKWTYRINMKNILVLCIVSYYFPVNGEMAQIQLKKWLRESEWHIIPRIILVFSGNYEISDLR